MPKSILVIEDEAPIRDMLRFTLETAGFEVNEAEDGSEASRQMASKTPDLILLDWMLPGISGIKWAQNVRANKLTRNIPIIMLTARAEEEHRLQGLEIGADDYIVKPFSPRELVARIKAVLRRGLLDIEHERLVFQEMCLDDTAHVVSIAGNALDLGPTEYRLLKFFLSHANRAYTREQILHHVWGPDVYIEERTVDVHVKRLRKILLPFDYAKYIQTVRSVGYRFVN